MYKDIQYEIQYESKNEQEQEEMFDNVAGASNQNVNRRNDERAYFGNRATSTAINPVIVTANHLIDVNGQAPMVSGQSNGSTQNLTANLGMAFHQSNKNPFPEYVFVSVADDEQSTQNTGDFTGWPPQVNEDSHKRRSEIIDLTVKEEASINFMDNDEQNDADQDQLIIQSQQILNNTQTAGNSKGRRKLIKNQNDHNRFKCGYCDFSVPHESRLKVHVRKHTNEKPYACNVCAKRFTQKCNLNTHLKKHKKTHKNRL